MPGAGPLNKRESQPFFGGGFPGRAALCQSALCGMENKGGSVCSGICVLHHKVFQRKFLSGSMFVCIGSFIGIWAAVRKKGVPMQG